MLSWLLAAITSIIVIVFAVMNRQAVTIDLWPFTGEKNVSLYLLILASLLIGLLAGSLTLCYKNYQLKRQLKKTNDKLQKMEARLAELTLNLDLQPKTTGNE